MKQTWIRNVKVMVLRNQSGSRSANIRSWSTGTNREKERGLAPGLTRAAAVAERSWKLRYSEGLPEAVGETHITRTWCGEVTGFYEDLCFRKTKEAKIKTELHLTLQVGTWSPHTSSLGDQWLVLGTRSLAIILGDCWLLCVGGLGRECPSKLKVFLQVLEVDCPHLWQHKISWLMGTRMGRKLAMDFVTNW